MAAVSMGPVRLESLSVLLRVIGGIPSLFWIVASLVLISRFLDLSFPILPAIVIGLTLKGIIRALGRRLKAESAEEAMRKDSRPPVVFLRSFANDRPSLFAHWTFEEQLARVLQKIGPVVALGNPEDRLTPLGAARLYANNQNWQNKVVELLESASCVVIFAGTTTGLLWEVETAVRKVRSPESMLIVLPLIEEESLRKRYYGDFRRHLVSMFPSLPPEVGSDMFLRFTSKWEADSFGPPPPKNTWGVFLRLHIDESLGPFTALLQQRLRGMYWRDMPPPRTSHLDRAFEDDSNSFR